MRIVPQKIDTAESGTIDTVVAHAEAVDSIAFTPVAKIEPQDVPIANGVANMTFASPVAEVNSSSYVQGDTTGTGVLTITYTDVNHGFATTTLDIPVTVTLRSRSSRALHHVERARSVKRSGAFALGKREIANSE